MFVFLYTRFPSNPDYESRTRSPSRCSAHQSKIASPSSQSIFVKRETLAALGVVVLMGAATFVVISIYEARNPSTLGSTSTKSASTSSSITSAVTGSNGLVLSMIANATSLVYGNHVHLIIDLVNMRETQNRVTLGSNWPAQNLSLSSCGREFLPYGIAMLSGVYDKVNLSLGRSIPLFPTSGCPNPYYTTPVYYVFQAMSDSTVTHYQAGPNATLRMFFTLDVGSYVDDTGMQKPMVPGTYTLVCGDSWGDLIISRLTVVSHPS
jgi:hypothetical protein